MFRSLLGMCMVSCVMLSLATLASARTPNHKHSDSRPASLALDIAPAYCLANHDIHNFKVAASNCGMFATRLHPTQDTLDCLTGQPVRAAEFPAGSGTQYNFVGAIWAGAVVGSDTLVSVGFDGWQHVQEFHPDEAPMGLMMRRSTLDTSAYWHPSAVSEHDLVGVYTGTFTCRVPNLGNDYFGRPHVPLGIEVTQESYTWSSPSAEDIVLLEYEIKNISGHSLNGFYFGVYMDADIMSLASSGGALDDMTGFISEASNPFHPPECRTVQPVVAAWSADDDGDLGSVSADLPGITGLSVIRTPSDALHVSYNWWVSNGNPAQDFGPQTHAMFREFLPNVIGTPEGDVNKYHQLRNGEIDYDFVYTGSIPPNDPIWVDPSPSVVHPVVPVYDIRYLLSFGPFNIPTGQTLPLTLAYVAGEGLHTDPDNFTDNIMTNYDPDAYYENLDFSDFIRNCFTAARIYDNPGVDTDSDGYSGAFVVCGGDTVYTSGDGVPDYNVDALLPIPHLRVTAEANQFTLH